MPATVPDLAAVVSALYGWDGAAQSRIPVESAAQPNLRTALYDGAVGPADVAAAAATLDETAATFLKVMATLYGRDPAAAGGSQMVRVSVESTAQPNLRASLWSAGNEAAVIAIASDAVANPAAATGAVNVASFGLLWDEGANNWDRLRSIGGMTNAQQTDQVGIGVPPAALFGMFDDTAPASTSENQFGALRMTPTRCLLNVIADPVTTTNRALVLAAGADAQLNTDDSLLTSAWGMGFNGTTWDRLRAGVDPGGAAATGMLGVLPMVRSSAGPNVYLIGNSENDAISGVRPQAQVGYLWNGTTLDRSRSGSAAYLSGTTQQFSLAVAEPGEWTFVHSAGANVQATATRAAGAAGVRHVARSIAASFIAQSPAPAGITVEVNLRNGASGAGGVLWQGRLTIQAVAFDRNPPILISGLNIVGTAATAMTLEFNIAGGANTFQTVSASGYSVS